MNALDSTAYRAAAAHVLQDFRNEPKRYLWSDAQQDRAALLELVAELQERVDLYETFLRRQTSQLELIPPAGAAGQEPATIAGR